eukprot:45786_1
MSLLQYIFVIFCSAFLTNATRPNFIFILTDDQDVTLDSMQALPNTIKYIANEGITFNNTFIATPICCPSRTETIAGRNFHNIKKQGDNDCMNIAATYNVFNNNESMFQVFSRNGYDTGSFGKLTNNMGKFWCDSNPKLKGFSRIHCPCDYNNFYGQKYFDKYINGTKKSYTLKVTPTAYETSFVGNASLVWIKQRLEDQKQNASAKPFIMWIGPHAPHYPATPAAWYADKYNTVKAPLTPNYNKSDQNKHSFVGTNPYITENASEWIDQLYRDRLRSLLSVDDMVYDIVTLLQQYSEQFANTYILYTSDHGYHLGQYDVPCSKEQPYEETIRIPMYMRGPTVPKNKISYDIVGNIDILPTFLSLAGIEYDNNTYDGHTWTDGILTDDMDADNYKRTTYLTQYQSVGTYGFSHCNTWFPASDGSVCPGEVKSPPEKNPEGKAWLVDQSTTNNWRALRIINKTSNVMYAEFVHNGSWNDNTFKKPYFYEFYDINADPFQMKNGYDKLSNATKEQLHTMLMTYGDCKGANCFL